MINKRKCAIIGCGHVGSTVAYTLMEHGIFSEMVLIDTDIKKARGEAMDLNHGLPFVAPMKIYAGDMCDISDAYIVIIAAGTNQKNGETRMELAFRNVEIFKSIIPRIAEVNNDCILLIVSNPVDILTYVSIKLSGYDSSHVIGSGTVLDTGRLKFLVGEHIGVDSRNVHSFIIGEHGDSELAVWSSANVSGVDLDAYCRITGKEYDARVLENMYESVRDSAYKIIEGKGATYYAIAQATLRIVRSIVMDQRSILPVSCLVDGHYGLSGICMGLPAVVGANGISDVLEIPLAASEQSRLHASAEKLHDVIRDIEHML